MEGYENYIWRSSDNKDLEEWKKSSNGFIHDRKFTDYLPDLYFNLNHGELSGQYRLEDSSFDLGISSITMHRSLLCIQKGKKITR